MIRHIISPAFAALLWALATPAVAQDGAAATIGSIDPNQPAADLAEQEPPICAYATAMTDPCGDIRPVTIGFRDNLGDASGRIEDVIAAHPLVRIGWSAEFEVSRDLHEPDRLVLYDMFNPPQVTAYPRNLASTVANNYDLDGIYKEGVGGRSVPLGKVGDPGLPQRFESVIREIVRVRALNLLSLDTADAKQSFCIENWDRDCPETGASDTSERGSGDRLHFGVRNDGDAADYVYVLLAGPGVPVQLIISPDDIGGAMLQPGALAQGRGEPIAIQDGRYQFFTIRSREPIDPRVFADSVYATGTGPGCNNEREQTLCSALSGLNVTVPDANLTYRRAWHLSVHNVYFDKPGQFAAGGGSVAPSGFAPWQVQIFSNQTYSAAQIRESEAAGLAGNLVYRMKDYQRYHRCAGSLIAPNVVLTAAHCVAKGEFTENGRVLRTREVRVGTQDLTDGGAIYRIEAVVVHQGYKPGSQKDDIALLRIAPKRGAIVQKPILLPDDVPGMRRVGVGSEIKVLGWGYTETVARGERHELPGGVAQFTTDRLRIATMTPLDQASCKKIRGYADIDKKICATTPDDRREPGNAFSCRNDSGGPVIQQLNRAGQVVQVGIVSGGVGCGAEENGIQNPSLFVDLQLFTGWIKRAQARLATLGNEVDTLP